MSGAAGGPVARDLSEFLADSLELWGVRGTVAPGEPPCLAVLRTQAGALVYVERLSGDDQPFRWMVRSRPPQSASGAADAVRSRPCGSLVGVLGAVRRALGVERGEPVRVAPPPHAQALPTTGVRP